MEVDPVGPLIKDLSILSLTVIGLVVSKSLRPTDFTIFLGFC